MSNNYKTTGQLLRSWIDDNCGTVRAFCRDIGFKESRVFNWCNNDAPISTENIALIAEYFAEITDTPPNVYVMRLTMHNRHVVRVINVWQKKQQKKRLAAEDQK